jgi:hypothetical protein
MTTQIQPRRRTLRVCEDLAIGYDSENRAIPIASGLSRQAVEECIEHFLSEQPEETETYALVEQWFEKYSETRLPAPPDCSSRHSPPDDLLCAKGRSRCCASIMILVRSRQGGFVSKNCWQCGKSYHVGIRELPDLVGDCCRTALVVKYLDGKNYFYVCGRCNRSRLLAELLPPWHKYFRDCGLYAGPFE